MSARFLQGQNISARFLEHKLSSVRFLQNNLLKADSHNITLILSDSLKIFCFLAGLLQCLTGSPGRTGHNRYCQEQSRLDHCHRRRQNLICSKHMRGGIVLRVYISIRSQIPSALSPIS